MVVKPSDSQIHRKTEGTVSASNEVPIIGFIQHCGPVSCLPRFASELHDLSVRIHVVLKK